MQKIMRALPFIMAVFFMLVTFNRVAILMDEGFNAGIVGWFFSGGMEIGEFIMSYYLRATQTQMKNKKVSRKVDGKEVIEIERVEVETSKSKQVRNIAWVGLIIFATIDSYFNMTQVLRELTEPNLYVAAVIYGLFPTVATILLGYMQASIDKLPKPTVKKGSIEFYMNDLMLGWLETAVMGMFYKRQVNKREKLIEIENLKRQAQAISRGKFEAVKLIEPNERAQGGSPEPETKSNPDRDIT